MRILLYIEPYPIRNTLSHFRSVAQRFAPILNSNPDFDVRMFSNNSTLESLGDAPARAGRLIGPTQEEEKIFQSHMRPWQHEGIAVWQDLMAGTGDVTEDYLAILRRIWNLFPFEIIIHWGENGAIRRFVDERPVTKIGMELGCTRPPFLETIAMDPFGTNGSGVVPMLTISNLREIIGDNPMSCQEALLGHSQNLESVGYEEQFFPLPADISARVTSCEKIAFLPLQLFDDANLLRFSPYNTVEQVVLSVVPKLVEKGYTVIVKPHPASEHRHSAATANAIARAALRPWQDKVIWCDHTKPVSNARLISISDFVVTVNSSVGFEALYFDKPVVVLGDAVYKPRDLFPTLEEMLSESFDRKYFLEGAAYLRRFMLTAYLQNAIITSDATAFLNRLLVIHEANYSATGNPVEFSRKIWGAAIGTQALARSIMFRGRSIAGTSEFSIPSKAATKTNPQNQAIPEAFSIIAFRLWLHANKSKKEILIAWLESAWATPDSRAEIIRIGQVVDAEFYLKTYPDVHASAIDPALHYAYYGMQESRLPRAGTQIASPDEMFDLLKKSITEMLAQQEDSSFPLTESEAKNRRDQLERINTIIKKKKNKIAVVAHLYYRDLVPALLEKIANIPEPFDLIITLPTWGNREITASAHKRFPDALFYQAPNRGRDIAPFLDVLPILLAQNYDAVLKIQTKRGYYKDGKLISNLGDLWRNETYEALLGSTNRVTEILEAFRLNSALNMIGPSPYFQPLTRYPYHDAGLLARMLIDAPEGGNFFAGTMFWLRPACLSSLQKLSMVNFSPEDGANDGAIAHLVERMFGQCAENNNGHIFGAPVDSSKPIEYNLQPSQFGLHDYLTTQLEYLHRMCALKPGGQLIW